MSPYGSGARYSQLHLLLDTLLLLCTGWSRVEEVGDYLGVSRRTAYRLIRVLIEAGIPLDNRPGRVGVRATVEYHLDRGWWRTATPRRGRATARERRVR